MLNIVQTVKEKILDILQTVKRNVNILINLLPVLSFSIPLLMLYSLYPYSFEQTLQGRTFFLFFLWLIILEIILSWEKPKKNKLDKLGSIKTVAFIITLLLPTIYVIAANYWGLNSIIEGLAKQNIPPEDPLQEQHASLVPLSTEYLVFTALFCLIILMAYGINGLTDFSISTLFLGTIGVLFTIDNLYPASRFPPLQILVPTTATLAANILNLMGYQTSISAITHSYYGYMPYLHVWDPKNPLKHISCGIAWPCAGVESLLIYTVTILLFLKKTDVPWKHRIIYFVIGAVVTYFINALRVVTLFVIAINTGGVHSIQFQRFHNYYGMLYSITWIMSYPLIIIGSRVLWGKIRNWKIGTKDGAKFSTRTKLSE
jgi:exosortase/archaeosortase family protein